MPPLPPLRLGVNIDHVATVRNARGTPTPDPLRAAQLAAKAGADGITAHLREDRRHIVDDDIARLMDGIELPLNSRWRRPRRWSPSRCVTGPMPPASCPRSARSGRPRAASMPSASTTT